MALRRRHIFLDMQYECDTSTSRVWYRCRSKHTDKNRPLLGAHTLWSELARAVAIRFSPSGVPLNYQCLCKLRVQVEERDLVRLYIYRLPPTRRMRGAAQ